MIGMIMLSGCLQTYIKMAGISEEDIEELGLGSLFGIKKTTKNPTTRVEAPKFVGMDILYVRIPKVSIPDAYEDIDILIGNNYYGSTAGSVTLMITFPQNFEIEEVLATTDYIKKDESLNRVTIIYPQMEYGEGDVVTINVKTPSLEETANVRYPYPISISLDYYYAVILQGSIPAISSSYYRALGGNITKKPSIRVSAGEISIKPRDQDILIRIPDEFFTTGESYSKTLLFDIKNVGKGVVLSDYAIYAITLSTRMLDIGIISTEGGWKALNESELNFEIESLKKIGLTYPAEILESTKGKARVYKLDLSKSTERFSTPLEISPSPELSSSIFEIPIMLIVVYKYDITKNIYLMISKVVP